METITIQIFQDDVYDEVAKATDYTGSKLIDEDSGARDRILAGDADLANLTRFWDETENAVNENLKEMLVSGRSRPITVTESVPMLYAAGAVQDAGLTVSGGRVGYEAVLEVSKSFDRGLKGSVQSMLRSFFIASIIGQWFKFANKGEAKDYFMQAAEMMQAAERLLYSRRKPALPKD